MIGVRPNRITDTSGARRGFTEGPRQDLRLQHAAVRFSSASRRICCSATLNITATTGRPMPPRWPLIRARRTGGRSTSRCRPRSRPATRETGGRRPSKSSITTERARSMTFDPVYAPTGVAAPSRPRPIVAIGAARSSPTRTSPRIAKAAFRLQVSLISTRPERTASPTVGVSRSSPRSRGACDQGAIFDLGDTARPRIDRCLSAAQSAPTFCPEADEDGPRRGDRDP